MVKISELAIQNPWWKHGKRFTHYDVDLKKANTSLVFFKRREFESKRENIFIIRGCRQIGKTTYLKDKISKLIKDGFDQRHILYLSLDSFVSRRELRNAINHFLNTNRDAEDLYIFLDEITSIEQWNHELKYLMDSGLAKRTRIIATGSCSMALRRETELLPGRGLEGNEYYMKPLTFRDFILQTAGHIAQHVDTSEFMHALENLKTALEKSSLNGMEVLSDLDQINNQVNAIAPFKRELEYLFGIYISTGGFPLVINNHLRKRFAESEDFVEPTIAEIFVRNVLGDISKVGKQESFARQILREIIDKYGTKYSFSRLAKDVNTTHVTAIDYLELLEESFIVTILYSYNFGKKDLKFKGSKKIYFQDPFIFYSLKNYLTGKPLDDIITETQQDEELLSKIIEGMVCSHLAMSQEIPLMKELKTFLWFYYDNRGREIDNILNIDGSYLGIEVKHQSSPSFKDIFTIPQIDKYILLTKEDVGEKGNVLMIPVDLFLSLIEKSTFNV